MIYRALECGIVNWPEPTVTVWFAANSDRTAGDQLMKLLAMAWQLPQEAICIGNVDSELAIESNSLSPPDAGIKRWYETGSHGDWPLYDLSAEYVFLHPREARKLREGKVAARAHARELAGLCQQEIAKMAIGSRQDGQIRQWRHAMEHYRRFAEGVVGYDF